MKNSSSDEVLLDDSRWIGAYCSWAWSPIISSLLFLSHVHSLYFSALYTSCPICLKCSLLICLVDFLIQISAKQLQCLPDNNCYHPNPTALPVITVFLFAVVTGHSCSEGLVFVQDRTHAWGRVAESMLARRNAASAPARLGGYLIKNWVHPDLGWRFYGYEYGSSGSPLPPSNLGKYQVGSFQVWSSGKSSQDLIGLWCRAVESTLSCP